MTHAAIPDAYLGVWRRRLLRTSAGDDTTTIVHWLQTPVWHADIRIPATRPTFAGARNLNDLDRPALLALAAQQGFAGVTTVEGDICRWHRRVDIQPPSGFSDVGRIVFENAERMLEHGIEQDYFEIWERVPASTGPWAALASTTAEGDVWLLRTGDHAIRVRPRSLAPADSLAAGAAGFRVTAVASAGGDSARHLAGQLDARRVEVERLVFQAGEAEGRLVNFREQADRVG
jgi:hypothetical protein